MSRRNSLQRTFPKPDPYLNSYLVNRHKDANDKFKFEISYVFAINNRSFSNSNAPFQQESLGDFYLDNYIRAPGSKIQFRKSYFINDWLSAAERKIIQFYVEAKIGERSISESMYFYPDITLKEVHFRGVTREVVFQRQLVKL